jgi:uncharacterized protein (TIGR00730 family)
MAEPPTPKRRPAPDEPAPAREDANGLSPEGEEGAPVVPSGPRGRERLRRKGQDPTLERGVDAKEMWRIFRIISEFVEAIDALREIRPAISVWGSARVPPDQEYYLATQETARLLASMGYTIITGGGPGLMEAANRGAKQGGGKSIGLGITLPMEQKMNAFCDVMLEFDYFFIRKMMFTKFAAGLLVVPGGFGTMDEFFDTLTLIQTRKIRRIPVAILGARYYAPLVAWMRERMLAEGMIRAEDLDLWLLTDDPKEAAEYLDRHIVEQTWWSQTTP